MTIFETLKALRAQQGLSQYDMAERMSSSQGQFSRLEKGGTDTKLSTIDKWADALGYEVKFVFVPKTDDPLMNAIVSEAADLGILTH